MSRHQASQQSSTMASWDGKMRFDSQLSRVNRYAFSMTLSWGHIGGNGISVMFGGTGSLPDMYQPAWSSSSAACAPGATAAEISAKCRAIAAVWQCGSTSAASLPSMEFGVRG
jgi:hypothetical protein